MKKILGETSEEAKLMKKIISLQEKIYKGIGVNKIDFDNFQKYLTEYEIPNLFIDEGFIQKMNYEDYYNYCGIDFRKDD